MDWKRTNARRFNPESGSIAPPRSTEGPPRAHSGVDTDPLSTGRSLSVLPPRVRPVRLNTQAWSRKVVPQRSGTDNAQ